MSGLTMELMAGEFKICRFSAETPPPPSLFTADWYTLSKTDDELSVVTSVDCKFDCDIVEDSWGMFKLIGPFPFDLTGIVAGISKVIAEADLGIFVISTYDTDYILIKQANMEVAKATLSNAGYILR